MQLRITGSGVRALKTFLTENGFNLDADQSTQKTSPPSIPGGDDTITPQQLRTAHWIISKLQSSKKSDLSLSSFLINRSKVIVTKASPIKEVVSEEEKAQLEKRKKKLQRIEEEARYHRMTRNIKHLTATAEIQQSIKSVRQHLTTGINMIVARITMFVVGYMISAALTDHETTVKRVLFRLKCKVNPHF
uniref:Uncharacterized protein AlNc14C35G3130 n=1 Tax=Albugo laibachii Nc14 TaxID=890382 RepID=F0W8K4_9STRA|nr:conserved hypothetical protein [Albugo laibachii Nc14]|eukprot:CCA17459.1 conserved hypothetical protein [Albugo laibachii Nc14]